MPHIRLIMNVWPFKPKDSSTVVADQFGWVLGRRRRMQVVIRIQMQKRVLCGNHCNTFITITDTCTYHRTVSSLWPIYVSTFDTGFA